MKNQLELIEENRIKISLPEIISDQNQYNGNSIKRLFFKKGIIEVTLNQSETNGLYMARPIGSYPFETIYIKKKQSMVSIPKNSAALTIEDNTEIKDISPNTIFKWKSVPNLRSLTPEEIVNSWEHKFRFHENKNENEFYGLRKPQIGALHSISSYFTLDSYDEPMTVVLPTGTGKTETMISTIVYQQCQKVMVLVPNSNLRKQISNKVLELGYLQELGIVPLGTQLPRIATITKGIRESEVLDAIIENANIIIATPNILKSSNEDLVNHLCENCSHLFIDEAHHSTANTWSDVVKKFQGKRIIQFTATPFRNDGKKLEGKIIYNFTMGDAQKYGYFTPINLHSIEEYFDIESDRSIARKAIEILDSDLSEGYDHLLLARTNNKDDAENIRDIYNELAPHYHPVVVSSKYGQQVNNRRLNKLLSRESRIVVCVDMLGEGYDLPNLKIAAIHENHKSLVVTLQFIGRFTRVAKSESLGTASVILNTADPKVEGDLERLYSQGADWDSILRNLSTSRIEREIRLQEIIDSLKDKGDLHKEISLWNIKPTSSVVLYSCDSRYWNPNQLIENLPKFNEVWYSISDEMRLLVVFALQKNKIKWGDFENIEEINYKIFILKQDIERNAVFVFSNDYKQFKTDKLIAELTSKHSELICGKRIFNLFNGIEYPLARNLGAAQNGAISFTQYFGPNVTEGLSRIEASQSTLSNIAVLGYEDGDRVTWGCSQRRGKIWSPQKGGSIFDWINWSENIWDKVHDSEDDTSNITKDFLRPEKITENYSEYPISVQWGEKLFSSFEDNIIFCFDDVEIPFYLIDINIVGANDDNSISIRLSSDAVYSVYRLKISQDLDGGYEYTLIEGKKIQIKVSTGNEYTFEDYMDIDPVTIYYNDRSFSYNHFLVKVPDEIDYYDEERIITLDWSNVDITNESMGFELD